jgi:hypothetical protein
MNNKSLLCWIIVFLAAALILTACSSTDANPASSANQAVPTLLVSTSAAPIPTTDPNQVQIPVFAQFQPLPPEQQAALAKPIEAQMAGSKLKVQAHFYTTTAKAGDVAAFYKNALKDWKADIGGTEPGGRVTMAWTNGLQSFQIIYAPDDTTPGTYLVMTSQVWP